MIYSIVIEPKVVAYLKKRDLVTRFQKAAEKILKGDNRGVDLKMRQPKSANIWAFRITKKYRAFARRRGNSLTVYAIDDHQ